MKIKATEKFSKLGSANNYAGFGKSLFQRIEQGEVVEFDVNEQLIEDGFVQEHKSNNKKVKEKANGN